MEPFIRPDQYHFIKKKSQQLINGHATTNDRAVTSAIKAIAHEEVLALFADMTSEQKRMLEQIAEVKDEGDALFYLSRVKQYIMPFPVLTEQKLKSLFPKEKKLHTPALEKVDWKELSYLGWNEPGARRKYLVLPFDGEWLSLRGQFTLSAKEGICTICKEHGKVGLMTLKQKGKVQDQSITRGNYMCVDSEQCNQHLTSLQALHLFIQRVTA
jgi:hypothetical protein